MKSKSNSFILAMVLALVITGIMVAGYNLITADPLNRIFQMLGGQMPFGIIQFMTYFAFLLGIFETTSRLKKISFENRAFNMNLLPEKENWVLSPDDVNDLKLKMIEYERSERYLLTDTIKKACTKFRSNKQVSDVLDLVSTQVKINASKAEGSQSIIRYLVWAIPSIGFIGTIIGIASSLGLASDAGNPEVLEQITDRLGVAFDTTLVSLLLSLVLMWVFHKLQEKEDNLHSNMEEYVIENLVNRIHVS